MGQLALGLRSLLIRSGVFFVMAALLAWALGGTLWPRDEIVSYPGLDHGGRQWFWQLVVAGRPPRQATWRMMLQEGEEEPRPLDDGRWLHVVGPIVVDGVLYFGGRRASAPDGGWEVVACPSAGDPVRHPMPDRLAVELQMARLEAGLGLQDAESVRRERASVLDPPPREAAGTGAAGP